MKTCYVDREHRAIADLCRYHPDGVNFGGYYITRINVPHGARGQGIASALLQQILADADAEGITLFLEIQPSDGLNYDELLAWYRRRGFIGHCIYKRLPRAAEVSNG